MKDTVQHNAPRSIVYGITVILAACSILYELLIAQTISFFADNTVFWYSITIGFFLGAMGLGALSSARLQKDTFLWAALYRVEIGLSVLGSLAVIVVHYAHIIWCALFLLGHFRLGMVLFLLLAALTIISVGFFTGLELPLLIKIGNELSQRKRVTNRILGADYFGSLIGGVIFPLVLLPHLELLTIGFWVAGINLIVAGFILFVFIPHRRQVRFSMGLGVAMAVMIVMYACRSYAVQQYFSKKYYYYPTVARGLKALFSPLPDFPDVQRYRSPYQVIDIVRMPFYTDEFVPVLIDAYTTQFNEVPDFPRNYFLMLDGKFQMWSDIEAMCHEYFAHVPIIVDKTIPRNVLVLGAGDGLLIRELIKYPQIERITHVDIDKKMVELARTDRVFRTLNRDALQDPRVTTIIMDAFHFLRRSADTYDAIYIDVPVAKDYNLSKLYSREFYHCVRNHVSETGFVVFDAPGITNFVKDNDGNSELPPENEWSVYYNTVTAAGFKTIVPFVTHLEKDNQAAIDGIAEVLAEYAGITKVVVDKDQGKQFVPIQGQQSMVTEIIDEYISEMELGFIMLKKKSEKVDCTFKNFGIKLHVLNKERFQLAFSLGYAFPKSEDAAKINSIMRPTLPNPLSIFRQVKVPF